MWENRRRGEEKMPHAEARGTRRGWDRERERKDGKRVLTTEMKRYDYQIGPAGQVSDAAPSGYHDDCVMALALGVWG